VIALGSGMMVYLVAVTVIITFIAVVISGGGMLIVVCVALFWSCFIQIVVFCGWWRSDVGDKWACHQYQHHHLCQ